MCGSGQLEISLTEAANGGSDEWIESTVASWMDTMSFEVMPVCIWIAESGERDCVVAAGWERVYEGGGA